MSGYRRVHLPLIPVGGWRTRAACAPRVKDMLWDDRIDGETEKQRDDRHAEAKHICNTRCPVRAKCADEADWKIDEGIRGGHKMPTLGSTLSADEEELLERLRMGLSLDDAVRSSKAS